MEKEIYEIPYRAKLCFDKNKGLILPEKIPYIGMGASYYAAEVIKYLGAKIYPELASEYCHSLKKEDDFRNAVFISQSGESIDTFSCAKQFQSYSCIVNSTDCKLANLPTVRNVIELYAGEESHASNKTYINTLITLYLGHGFNPYSAIESIHNRFNYFKELGESYGASLAKRIRKKRFAGIYIIGNGPNIGTAHQAAQVLTETTKLPFIGLPASQYYYGLKEAAPNSIVFVLNPAGEKYEKTHRFLKTIESAGAIVFELKEDELSEELSPFSMILPFFFMATWLSSKLNISDDFIVGDKIITE